MINHRIVFCKFGDDLLLTYCGIMGLGNGNDGCVFVCCSYRTNYFLLIVSVLSKWASWILFIEIMIFGDGFSHY